MEMKSNWQMKSSSSASKNRKVQEMRYLATAASDQGTTRSSNQDTIVLKHLLVENDEFLMGIVCDGMGGLSKGELASATVIREFSTWFNEVLVPHYSELNLEQIAEVWKERISDVNRRLNVYSEGHNLRLGTTFTGLLILQGQVLIMQVGDSRAYHNAESLRQITTDQSFVQREVELGHLTPEQARVDRRRNILLQCIGSKTEPVPQVILEPVKKGFYLLCSDGFYHELSSEEVNGALNPDELTGKDEMQRRLLEMISVVKNRGERDNISAILIQAV